MSEWVIVTPVGLTIVLGFSFMAFLVLIALITLFNIINSIAMSVVAKMKQYGVFRAIGLSNRQLAKMIIAEASTYAITGTICGSVLGIVCNKILFSKLITYKWGDAWSVPLVQLGIIIVVVAIAVILAVRNPIKKLEKTSIVDIISVQ
ncbi:MAG: FtsX-like permease family protein [Blautia wexlerae]